MNHRQNDCVANHAYEIKRDGETFNVNGLGEYTSYAKHESDGDGG
jgi:hypothetical protein